MQIGPHVFLQILGKHAALFPLARQKVEQAGERVAVGGKSVAKHKAVKAHVQRNAKQPAQSNAQHHAVQQRQHHAKPCVSNALDKCTAAAHHGKGRDHPKDGGNKGVGHGMHQGVVRKEHKHLLAKANVQKHKDYREHGRKDPRVVHHLLGTLLLARANVLADHRHGGILDALRDLVDNVVNAHAHAKGGGFDQSHAVDHRVDKQHGEVDAPRLNCHGGAKSGNHPYVFFTWNKAFLLKIKSKLLLVAEEVIEREKEGNGLPDDGCPRRARNAPTQKPGKEQVEHQIDRRSNGDEQKGPLGIPHAAQDRRDHVIPRGKKQACGTNDEIFHCHVVGLGGNVHYVEDPHARDQNDSRQHHRQRKNKAKQRTDDVVHFFFLACAQRLRDQHLTGVGKAEAYHGGKVDDLAALRHGRKPGGADEYAHDHHVDGAVQHLHGVGRHKGKGKPKKLPRNISLCKVLG